MNSIKYKIPQIEGRNSYYEKTLGDGTIEDDLITINKDFGVMIFWNINWVISTELKYEIN